LPNIYCDWLAFGILAEVDPDSISSPSCIQLGKKVICMCVTIQALQAPACHENMVKVGGYILGEFGNLIAGDQRSSPLVQFQLLHSKVSFNLKQFLLAIYIIYV
jgi:hypothetical protein